MPNGEVSIYIYNDMALYTLKTCAVFNLWVVTFSQEFCLSKIINYMVYSCVVKLSQENSL